MHHRDWNRLHNIVVQSVQAVLSDVGIHVRNKGMVTPSEAQWAETISIIGFGGPSLQGSISLSIPHAVLRRFHPTGAEDSSLLVDWQAELANLVVGRLKGGLLVFGVETEVSTPLAILGNELRYRRFSGLPIVQHFEFENSALHVMFEGLSDTKVALSEDEDASAKIPNGDVVLF